MISQKTTVLRILGFQMFRSLRNVCFAVGLLPVFLMPSASAQAISPDPLDCGKYSMVQVQGGYTCHRTGHVPWYAAQPGVWETELVFGVSSADFIRFGYGESRENNLQLWDRLRNAFFAESVYNIDLRTRSSYRVRILGMEYCFGACNGTGSLYVSAEALTPAALDAATASFTYKYFAGTANIVSETTIPVIFEDQASNRWRAIITETPRSRQGQPGTTITAFAIKNLGAEQAVRFTLFDMAGIAVASVETPAISSEQGFLLSSLLTADLPVGQGSTDFHGTIVFEGKGGGKIAPIVLQMTDMALTAVSADPE
jgi:hypothetical protein